MLQGMSLMCHNFTNSLQYTFIFVTAQLRYTISVLHTSLNNQMNKPNLPVSQHEHCLQWTNHLICYLAF